MNHTYQYKTDKVQAIKWTGKNIDEVKEFLGDIKVVKGKNTLKIFHNGFSYVDAQEWIIRHQDGEITTDHNSHFVQTFEKVPDEKPERRRFIEALNKIKGMDNQIGWAIDEQEYSPADVLKVVYQNIDHIFEEFDIDVNKLMSEL